jgi:multidrug efflux pump subunit AcrB
MYMVGGLLLERISLGALIIALCMLTDNAIIVIEGIKVRIEAGEDKLTVVRDVVAKNQWPLFGATAIGVIAFAAIGLSEDSTGEYCNSLFWVILISLSLSWMSSITVTPLLGYMSFRPLADAGGQQPDPYGGIFFQSYRRLLELALRFRWGVVAAFVGLFFAALFAFSKVDQSFFPPASRPQFMVDCYLPSATHIRESEAFADQVGQFIQSQPGVTHVTSFIGGGGLRFLLVYSPERENRAYVQFLVDVDDQRKIDGLIETIQTHLDEDHPNANAIAKKFLLGPGDGGHIQVRFRGPDPAKLRDLSGQALRIIEQDGGGMCIRHDWREREKALRPHPFELPARRNGITRVEVGEALQLGFEGRVVGFYREPGSAGAGIFPQETRLLPIVARPPLSERGDVDVIRSMQIWSPVAGRMIPLGQIVSNVELDWEDPVVMRRDRHRTITVHADPRSELPSRLLHRVKSSTVLSPPLKRSNCPPATNWNGGASTRIRAQPSWRWPVPSPRRWR